MNVIYKYFISTRQLTILELPKDSKLLRVADQHGEVTLWIEQTSPEDTILFQQRRFLVYATGEPYNPVGKQHVGTVLVGDYVWHLPFLRIDTPSLFGISRFLFSGEFPSFPPP